MYRIASSQDSRSRFVSSRVCKLVPEPPSHSHSDGVERRFSGSSACVRLLQSAQDHLNGELRSGVGQRQNTVGGQLSAIVVLGP